MTRVALIRTRHTDQGTQGVLILPEGVFCNTLELPWRENKPKISCIPCGEFDVKIRQSPRFGTIYEVQDVPDRRYILIHSGNLAGDVTKGYRSHVEGCILLGKYFGTLDSQLAILYSRPTVREFMDQLDRQPFRLIVEDQSCGK
jgi:hypothetical protein